MAATLAAQECVWLRRLIKDVYNPIHKPTNLFSDNESSIKLASNPVCHARTKHIEIEHHFIREKVLNGTIKNLAVRRNLNIAEVFTKGSLQRTVRVSSGKTWDDFQNYFKGECQALKSFLEYEKFFCLSMLLFVLASCV